MRADGLETAAVAEKKPSARLDFSLFSRDVATLGTGTLLAAVLGTLQVFVIPRIVSVEDFGYWRLFLLYASFAGLLHMGFADGALLQWAGRPLDDFFLEIRPSLKFLFWQQVAILALAGLIAISVLPSAIRLVVAGVLAYALIYNTSSLLQYVLQAARQFKPVAAVRAAPAGIFLALAVLWSFKATPGFRILILLYVLAWICVLIFLWASVRPLRHWGGISSLAAGKQFLALGWPIVLSSTSYGLIQSADRLVVSSVLSINQFAQYSFAASTLFVPITAISAVSQVFFPHVAAIKEESRAKAYASASRLLVIAWSLLLPYYFLLESFVHRFLPNYVGGLSVAGVLLFSVVFFAGIQILHSSFFNLYGLQRRFLQYSGAAVLLGFALVILAAVHFRTLVAVAVAQVVAVALWWQFNEWKLKAITEQSSGDWLRSVCLFLWSGLGFWIAASVGSNVVLRVGLFYLIVVPGLVMAHPLESRMALRMARTTGLGGKSSNQASGVSNSGLQR